jgi:hypothetical protein
MEATPTQVANLPRVYKLNHDLDRFQDENFDGPEAYAYDCWLMNQFPGWKEIKSGFYAPVPITLTGERGAVVREQGLDERWYVTETRMPEQIRFEGDAGVSQGIDYLYAKTGWSIMSKRMLNVLLSIRPFPHQAIPVVIEDCRVMPSEAGWKRASTVNGDYVILQLLEHLDALDLENSVYYHNVARKASNIEKSVFREPEGGFPPIFRLSVAGARVPLYVSAEAKTALEVAGVTGVSFSTYQLSSIPYM